MATEITLDVPCVRCGRPAVTNRFLCAAHGGHARYPVDPSPEVIVAANRVLARLLHPGKGGSHEAMIAINAAATIREKT